MKDALAPQGLFEDLGLKYVGPIDGHDRTAMEGALDQGQALRRPGHRARDHPQGLRLRPGRAARGRPVPRARPVRRPDRRREAQGTHLDRPLLRRDRRGRRAPQGRRRHHRRDDAPGRPRHVRHEVPRAHLRRRHRRAARRDVGRRPGHRRPAPRLRRLRDLPQPRLRPGADGRARCTGAASRSCSTAPASPATTAPATTACGTCRSSRWCPACGWPRRATSPGCASCSTRRSTSPTRPTVVRFPKGPPPEDIDTLSARPAVPTCWCAPATQDVLVVAVGSMCTVAVDVAERLTAQGIGVTVVDPRWVKPVDPAIVELAASTALVVSVEDNGRVGRLRCRAAADPQRRRRDHAVPPARHPAGVPRPRQARRHPGPHRPGRPDHRARHRRGRRRRTTTVACPSTSRTRADLRPPGHRRSGSSRRVRHSVHAVRGLE